MDYVRKCKSALGEIFFIAYGIRKKRQSDM